MKFGLIVPQGWREDLPGRDFETMVGVAQAAERLGFDSIWLYDHLQTRAGDPDALFECWTSLAALARETSTVRLGQIVTSRSIAIPACSRRWPRPSTPPRRTRDRRRRRGLGRARVPRVRLRRALPPVRERLAHLEETLQVLRARERGCRSSSAAAARRCCCGWSREYADACNFTDSFDPAFYRHKLDVLRRHCDDVGRDYDAIEKTASFTVHETSVDFDALAAQPGSRRSSSTSIRRPTSLRSNGSPGGLSLEADVVGRDRDARQLAGRSPRAAPRRSPRSRRRSAARRRP